MSNTARDGTDPLPLLLRGSAQVDPPCRCPGSPGTGLAPVHISIAVGHYSLSLSRTTNPDNSAHPGSNISRHTLRAYLGPSSDMCAGPVTMETEQKSSDRPVRRAFFFSEGQPES
uniref:Uncharacterized protein n=1 Tax=Branchiostoma floridae TaxID=7739 RepID=C3ZD07_BRAFL|eukprot:XP_002593507.1 hypothetical protein BRAFLDRAFT_101844 [Branchiostoma floridae]